MKSRAFLTMTCLSGGLILNTSAMAEPHLVVVSHNTTDGFLTANGLQSAVIGVTGFSAGENLMGFIATSNYAFELWTTSGDGFFNVESSPTFDGQSQWAATAANAPPNGGWDTGVLSNATTSALGVISSNVGNPIGFAQFGVNHNSGPGTDVVWRTLSPVGIVVAGTVNLFRLTWSADYSATFSAVLETNTGGGTLAEIPVSITIPPVPGPGGLAVAGVACVVGKRRRRSCE